MTRRVLITGCSGAGKSTLVQALGARGYAVVPEPGRRIVNRARRGTAPLPASDPGGFALAALAMARRDFEQARCARGVVFFDRGVLDAAVARAHLGSASVQDAHGPTPLYAKTVFLAPPWRALFARDRDRRHGFDEAVAEYHRIAAALPQLGYRTVLLPRMPVTARVRFVLKRCIAPRRPAG